MITPFIPAAGSINTLLKSYTEPAPLVSLQHTSRLANTLILLIGWGKGTRWSQESQSTPSAMEAADAGKDDESGGRQPWDEGEAADVCAGKNWLQIQREINVYGWEQRNGEERLMRRKEKQRVRSSQMSRAQTRYYEKYRSKVPQKRRIWPHLDSLCI